MEQNTSALTEEIQNNSIDKYKASLFKLWKQSCEKQNNRIIEYVDTTDIKKLVNYNSKDDTVNSFINDVFDNNIIDKYYGSIRYHNLAYYYNIDKKKLSISKMILDINIGHHFTIKTSSKGLFSSKITEKVETVSLQNYTTEYLIKYFFEKSNNKIKIINRTNFPNSIDLSIGIPLLTYNNIFIPITFQEFEYLRCYELESRRKDDMEDVYRQLTLLTPSEYKEFIMWKESQKIYEIKDSK